MSDRMRRVHPSLTKTWAQARPMPEEAPVMRATLGGG
jgi:hypothetical protein